MLLVTTLQEQCRTRVKEQQAAVGVEFVPQNTMKGISRAVVPYKVEGLLGQLEQRPQVIREHVTGLGLFLDLEAMDGQGAERKSVSRERSSP